MSEIDTIREARCDHCGRLVATAEDWKFYGEGEGVHLCWDGMDSGCVCLDVTALIAERAALLARAARAEAALRREWWMNHGHPFAALYGDDGEMQCAACPADFKRQSIDELHEYVTAAVLAGQEGKPE